MTTPFTDNAAKSRFEYAMNGAMAIANYRRIEKTLYIDYVEAPPELRGTGAAGKLMQEIVNVAQKENLTIVPICGYAASWIAKNGASKNPKGP